MSADDAARVLSDADRALLAEAARLAQEPVGAGDAEGDRLARYLALERALGTRGTALAGDRRDDSFVRRVVAALPAAPPAAADPAWAMAGQAVMRLLALPATLVIIASFHETFEWQHWLAASVLAVAPASLLLRGYAKQQVRIRDLVYGGALIASLCLTILALARAIDSHLAHDAGWCCFVFGLAMLGATWTTRVIRPDVMRRLTPLELFVCHQLGIVAFLGGSCLVLHS